MSAWSALSRLGDRVLGILTNISKRGIWSNFRKYGASFSLYLFVSVFDLATSRKATLILGLNMYLSLMVVPHVPRWTRESRVWNV